MPATKAGGRKPLGDRVSTGPDRAGYRAPKPPTRSRHRSRHPCVRDTSSLAIVVFRQAPREQRWEANLDPCSLTPDAASREFHGDAARARLGRRWYAARRAHPIVSPYRAGLAARSSNRAKKRDTPVRRRIVARSIHTIQYTIHNTRKYRARARFGMDLPRRESDGHGPARGRPSIDRWRYRATKRAGRAHTGISRTPTTTASCGPGALRSAGVLDTGCSRRSAERIGFEQGFQHRHPHRCHPRWSDLAPTRMTARSSATSAGDLDVMSSYRPRMHDRIRRRSGGRRCPSEVPSVAVAEILQRGHQGLPAMRSRRCRRDIIAVTSPSSRVKIIALTMRPSSVTVVRRQRRRACSRILATTQRARMCRSERATANALTSPTITTPGSR